MESGEGKRTQREEQNTKKERLGPKSTYGLLDAFSSLNNTNMKIIEGGGPKATTEKSATSARVTSATWAFMGLRLFSQTKKNDLSINTALPYH